jgi:hypothetical protein
MIATMHHTTTKQATPLNVLAPLLLATTLLIIQGCADRHPVAQPDGGPGLADLWHHGEYIVSTGDIYSTPDWTCGPSKLGIRTCLRKSSHGGMPPMGTQWQCHLGAAGATNATTWNCYGFSGSDPSGLGWTCTPFTALAEPKRWRCTRPDSDVDRPPEQGPWVCVKGDAFGGTRCQRVPKPHIPPNDFGGACVPGQKRWCDNTIYDGWSTVDCDPATGQWRTKSINGKPIIDCSDPTLGVPLTLCARYHFFFNAACCERQDCVVPEGTSGQGHDKSSGGLCAFCNPLKPECTASGAQCIVTNAHETFCSQLCSADADCAGPGSYTCMKVKMKLGTTMQCVPTDFSCYY